MMIGRFSRKLTGSTMARCFSDEMKQRMEVTLRSPYKTYMQNFEGFTKVVANTNEGALVIQSKMPAAAYVLEPGVLKVHLSEELKDLTGEFVHAGGFAVIHPNNTLDINLIECFDKKEIELNKVADSDVGEANTETERYIQKIRREARRNYARLG